MRRLAPLSRFLVHEDSIAIDLVMRRIRARFGGDMYYLSVKVSTPHDTYMAVATENNLGKALTAAREVLRRSISRGASVVDYGVRRSRRQQAAYTLTL